MGEIIMSTVTSGAPSFPCGPCVCRNVHGDTIPILTVGIASCLCVNPNPGTASDRKLTLDPATNGAFTANYVAGVDEWQTAGIGTSTLDQYNSTDLSCVDVSSSVSGSVTYTVACVAGVITRVIGQFAGTTIYDSGPNPVQGVPTANTITCDGTNLAAGGTLTWG